MTINDLFPSWLSGSGFMTALTAQPVPWADDISGAVLDMEYHGNVSGEKTPSPLVGKMLVNGSLPPASVSALASLVWELNKQSFEKDWAVLGLEYNPIENYDGTETETITKTGTNTGTVKNEADGSDTTSKSLSGSVTGSGSESVSTQYGSTITKNGTEITNTTRNDSTNTGVYGFNSAVAVPDSTSETESKVENGTVQNSQTEAKTGGDGENRITSDSTTTSNTESGSVTYGKKDTETRNLANSESTTRNWNRHGNIGVTTSQQMIQSEIDLWMWNYFYNVVFPACDRVLANSVYEGRS